MKHFISSAILFLALIFTHTLFAKVYYVNGSYTGTPANGNTWATPFKKMEDAIAAAVDGDEVWVAKGTYVAPEDSSTSGYYINNGIAVYGGFAGTETSIYARDLTLNKTFFQGRLNQYGNYGNVFNIKQNKKFVIDGCDLTKFGNAFVNMYDTLRGGQNLQIGDRYKLTINNCNIYNGHNPVVFFYHTDLFISNSSYYNIANSIVIYANEPSDINSYSIITFENSNIQGASGSNLMYSQNAQLNVINCRISDFNNNVFPTSGARECTFKGSTFKNISSYILSSDNTSVLIDECTFENITAGQLFVNSNTGVFKVSNSIFKNSTCGQLFISKNLSFDNVVFSNINFSSRAIQINEKLTIKNSIFDNIRSFNNYFIQNQNDSEVEIDNVTVKNSDVKFLIKNNGTKDVSIKNCLFENNTLDEQTQNGAFLNLSGEIYIDACQFLNNDTRISNTFLQQGLISTTNNGSANFHLTNSTFKNTRTNSIAGVIIGSYLATFEIDNCLFENNTSEYSGQEGTGVIHSNSSLKIRNTKFINNAGSNYGAIFCYYNLELENCLFQKNKALIKNEYGSTYSGAVGLFGPYYLVGTSMSIKKCSFIENESIASAGAICTYNCDLQVEQSSFINNKVQEGSSVISATNSIIKINNSLFEGNQSQSSSLGIIYNLGNTNYNSIQPNYDHSTIEINNSTFVKNISATGINLLSGNVPTKISNSIFWANGANAPIGAKIFTPIISNSNIQGGFTGTKVYDVDPKFVDFAGGNYRLSCESPLINKGNNAYASGFDLDGSARIFADTVDIGAYETHIDPALANAIPAPAFTLPESVCKSEVLTIANTTANSGNYTYQWTFGNGDKSTLLNPTYTYLQPGTYDIKLTATNFCGQSNALTKQLVVRAVNAPTITVVSVICPGEEATYTTDAACQSIAWTVTGGLILSGQNSKSIRVAWGDGSTGNGKITLLATGCGTAACELPVVVEVPIVPVSFTLTGNTKVCQGSIEHYGTVNKDKSPGTLYTWSAKGGSINTTSKGYNLTDVDVQWNTTATDGVVYLATYNELLKCGKKDSFIVSLRPAFNITGPVDVCIEGTNTYAVSPSVGTMQWTVAGTGNTIDASGKAIWGITPGMYNIIASPTDASQACNIKDTFVVAVHAKPIVTGITGETEVALKSTEIYTAQVSADINDIDLHWFSSGGVVASAYLNTATIYKKDFLPDFVSVVATTKKGICKSDTFKLKVTELFKYTITGPDTICIGTSGTYTANANPNYTADYSWTSTLNAATFSGNPLNLSGNNVGGHTITLTINSNGKKYTIYKYVYVKSSNSNISIEGPQVTDPTGLQTLVYTVKNPANANYLVNVIGGTVTKLNNQLTVKWGGTEPFIIEVADKFNTPACNGAPITYIVKKAKDIGKGIISSGPACLNSRITYSFAPDELTGSLTWSLNGGGSIISRETNSVTIEWNQTGSHILTLAFERFGAQTINTPIVVNALPTPALNPGTICGSSSFTLSTTQSYSDYIWYLNDEKASFSNQANPPVTTEGMYTVSVTDNNGCVNSGSKYIKQLPLPKAAVFTLDNVVVCTDPTPGARTNIKLSTFEGLPYVYEWYENNVPLSNGGATPYTLSVQKSLNQAAVYSYKVKVSLETCVQISEVKNVIISSCTSGGGTGGTGGGGIGGGGTGGGNLGGGCTDPAVSFTLDPNWLCQTFSFIVDPSITSGSGLGWDFGDGSTGTGLNMSYGYRDAGIYNVQLTRGCRYYTAPVKVLARALFKLDQPGCVGQELLFKDLSVNIPSNKIISRTWNFGDSPTTQLFTGDAKHTYATAGTYKVTITVVALNDDNKPCTFTFQNDCEINTIPIANYNVVTPSCVGSIYTFADNSTFNKYGKGSLKWTFGNGQTSVRDTTLQQFAAGNQSVQLKVTDLFGCTNTKSSTINVKAPEQIGKITVSSKDTLLCNGNTVVLVSPASVNTYQWNKNGALIGGATNQTYNVTAPGSYSVTYGITLGTPGCTATTGAIKVNSFTVPNLISGNKLTCIGTADTIKSNLSPSEYTFIWQRGTTVLPNNSATLIINDLKATDAGSYILTVKQIGTGCTAVLPPYAIAVNANPTKPVINTPSTNICYNTAVTINTTTTKTGKTFAWFENTKRLSAVDTVITTSALKSDANYQVSVKDNTTGCSTLSDNLIIKVAPQISVVLSGDTVVCEKIYTELKSAFDIKDYTFQWYKNDQPTAGNTSNLSFISIARADSGIYKLKITSLGTTNVTGCTGVSNIKTVKVKPTAATPVITGANEFCSGNTVTLTNNLTSDFVWNTGATTPSITIQTGGNYSVTATNVLTGCKITTTKTVVQNPLPDLGFIPYGDYTRCGTNKISFEGLLKYPILRWNVNGVYFSDQATIYPTKSGNYTLQATTNKGCIAISDTMHINALECPCYVTNTNDSGDGSLREAINCSNEKPGRDAIKFEIKGVGPFTIKPLTALPVITEAVVIDGFTQPGTSAIRIIVDGTTKKLEYGFKVNDNLSNVLIRGIEFTNFQKAIVLSSKVTNTLIENVSFKYNTTTAIELNYGTQNNIVRNNSILSGVAGIQLLTGSKNNIIQSNTINNATSGIELNGASNNTLRSNIIFSSYKDGITLKSESTNNLLIKNTIRSSANNGILLAEKSNTNKIDSNYVGIDADGNVSANVLNGVYISPNTRFNEITNNSISGNTQAGIVVEGNQTKIFKNLIGVNANDVAKSNGSHGIYITGDSAAVFSNTISTNGKYGINVKGKSAYVYENKIRNNTSGGINVDGNKDRLSKNIITNTNTAVNAINLNLTTTPGNGGKIPAEFKNYRRSPSGGIILTGTTTIGGNDIIEIFYNNNKPQQALVFAGSTVANAAGNWSIEIPEGPAFNPNDKNFYVNTATNVSNNTSELSKPYLTGCFTCICLVTNINDSGLGSFRAEIDSANAGACLTINFSMTAPDTIQLLSAINPLKVPATIDGPSGTTDPMVFVKGSTTFNGLTIASDGATVRDLGFTQFNQALVLNSSFNNVEKVTIINTKRPLTITGDSSTVLSSAINTTWANDLGTFKTDIAVNITGKGNQIGGSNAGNKITNVTNAGILVDAKTGNALLNNVIYSSAQAIKLTSNGNNNYVAPTNMLGAINGSTASIQGVAKPGDKIQIFSSVYTGGQAFGFVVEAIADASGNWTATIPSNKVDLTRNNYFVATATSTTGNTSPLSGIIRVGNFTQVCYVTNTNNAGEGSLREAVNCANIAGMDPNGLPARIEFQLPATPNVITLASGLVITNGYGVSVNARAIPVTVKAASSIINGFNWATNNFTVKNLVFENFENALNCTGRNALIDSNTFVNNNNSIYNNAADASHQITVTNNYFAGGTSGIRSDKGSVLIDKNTFGSTKAGTATPIKGFGIASSNAASAVLTNNTFASISKSEDATIPAAANGYVISVENARSVITNNTIQGEVSTQLPVIRLANNTQSTILSNTISTAYEGILLDNCNAVTVSQNNLKSVSNKGFNLNKSVAVKITQNTIVGLQPNTKPIALNLATVNVSNNSKQTPVILTSTYHDGKLFLIGQAEKLDEVELFYSNKKELDLVKYIEKAYADTTGTWIISFPISAEGSDTLFFRAVATKDVVQSSEASAAFTPKLKICPVTTKDDSGDGSLRQAIVDANADKCNLIQFKIPGSGVAEIRTTSLLPAITAKLLIVDGTSQAGYRKGSPTVDLIHTAAIGFDGQNGNQLDIYGMKITNFGTAINSVNAKISNLNDNIIENATSTGIKISTASFTYGNIKNNIINTSGPSATGILLDGTTNMEIMKNIISGFGQSGINTKGNNQKITTNTLIASDSISSIGIALNNSVGVYILSDTILQAGTGIQVTNGSKNQIASNVIGSRDKKAKANKYVTNIGVSVNNSPNCDVSLNMIAVSTMGISLTGSNTFLIYSNTSNKVRDKGIYLKNSSNGTVSNNTVDSSSIGMLFDNSAANKVYNNLITRSHTYGIQLDAGSDGNKFNANLIGARYVGDPTYAEGAGMLVKSSNNLIGNSPIAGLGNYIKQNKKGGIIVDGGTRNAITYNFFYNNDITKGKPTAFAIELKNGGNTMKVKPSVTSHKWIEGKLHVSGTGNAAGDSIHLYLGTGGYEEVSKLLKADKSTAAGNWTLIVDTAGYKLPKRLTWYVVATATDMNYNTSPLSDMYILGDCYVTSLKDIADDTYPLPNTLRMAMKCANGQANPVGVYFNVADGGAKEVKLEMKLLALDNHYGVRFDGMNIPDSIIAGMNGQKLASASWTIAPTNAKSSIANFNIVNAQDGLEVLADSILVQKIRFDEIINAGILLSNKYNVVDSCVFDTVAVGIIPSAAAFKSTLSGNTFNSIVVGIKSDNTDSLIISANTFNSGVKTGVDIRNSTRALITSNTFINTASSSKSITWDNTKGLISQNVITAKFVDNPVSVSNSTDFYIYGNKFADSADVYLSLSDVSKGMIEGNTFMVANENSIKTTNAKQVSIIGNYVQRARGDAFNLISSSTVFVSKNTVTAVRYASKQDSALCINIHKGESVTQSNLGKEEPKNLKYEVKPGIDRRIGIFVNGLATAGDSIEVFFSDTISASMNRFVVKTFTQPNGVWEVKIPREFYYNDTTTWYHVIAVAIDADSNTSKTSAVLDIPPGVTKLYVLNEYDAGPNSLRQALLDVNNSDLYSQVIFSICLPKVKEGPYNIAIDSLLAPVFSYNGFKMDGFSQKENIGVGPDQRILVNGNRIKNNFGLDITEKSKSCLIKNMWMINTKMGLRLENEGNEIDQFNFINTDSSGVAKLDTAIHITKKSNENKLKNIFISDYTLGALITGAAKNEFTESIIDSTTHAVVLAEGASKSLIAKNTFTNIGVVSVHIDHAGDENKIDHNIFGKQKNPVIGNIIVVNSSNSQNIVYNRISYFDVNDTLPASTAVVIQGLSSGNYVYANRIGLDSLGKSVYKAKTQGVVIQSTAEGVPVRNSIVGNEINGTNAGAIYAYNSSEDLISENIIGGDSTRKIFGFDSTGIFISNCNNENVSDNVILGFSKYGIELLTSDNIQMHRNSLYSHRTKNKAININSSNLSTAAPVVTSGVVIDMNTMKVGGTAKANTQVEVFRSLKDTMHAVSYINKVTANAAGDWELMVPREQFTYSARNSFTAQTHDGTRSSELAKSFTPIPALCQLNDNPAIKVIEPVYRPCPGPEFTIDPDLDPALLFAWKAPEMTDTLKSKIINIQDTTMNLNLTVRDTLGCKLSRNTDVIFKKKPADPDFIISSNVFAGDTIVLVDISLPKPDSVKWFSSAGVTVLRSSNTSKDSLIGDDGLVYPKDVRFIQFILPEEGTYSIRQKSILDGCFVEQTKTLTAKPKDPNASNPYFVAPAIESMYVYPNPCIKGTDDVFINISVATKSEITLELYTEKGALVREITLSGSLKYDKKLFSAEGDHLFENNLASGVYILKLSTSASRAVSFKLVIQ